MAGEFDSIGDSKVGEGLHWIFCLVPVPGHDQRRRIEEGSAHICWGVCEEGIHFKSFLDESSIVQGRNWLP